ncbi:probable RNA-binding protein CG14230 [Homalodisca vitripennis]|uniref:probable RNA-binding protein CG14230 n=1 Tax=Homalodisca vitripennis TaxID=197043 RepID=UPI001EEBBC4C|nr:probable RNA-binding protein CG14230 [Homalodisca vitripennis]
MKSNEKMSHSSNNFEEDKLNGNLLPFRGTIKSMISKKSTQPIKSLKQTERDVQNKLKLKDKKRHIDNSSEDSKNKQSKYDPTELMNKLEEFSNVWNDYPTVNTENNVSGHWFKGNVDRQVRNSSEENEKKIRENFKTHKDKSYSQILFERKKTNEGNVRHPNSKNDNIRQYSPENKTKDSEEREKDESSSVAQVDKNSIEKYDSKLADLKRKKAVQEQRQLLIEKKNIIKQALSMDGKNKINKKIIFNDPEESEERHQQQKNNFEPDENKTKGRQKLFEDDDSEFESDFKLNHQFEGKKGQKLLELQSRFASDSRFTLDKRFYESNSEESEHEGDGESSLSDEKKKQLAILESIVNQQIKPLSEIKKARKNAEETFMVRFDPSREDHEKYIVKPQEETKDEDIVRKKKKTREDESGESTNVQSKSEVSNEKFYTVKEDLKETLKNEGGTGFSLLRLFGSKEEPQESDNKPEDNRSRPIKKLNPKAKNPFKYDSSDSELEQEEPEKREDKPPVISWKTTFFFTDSDTRLQEAFEFLKIPDETGDIEVYTEKRKMLKNFIRHKVKNNNRKKIHFKKKLGGLKKTFKTKLK